MAVDALAGRLDLLLAEGSLVSSALSEPMRARLEPLFWTKALAETRAGAGKRVVLRDREAVERWIEVNYPSGLNGTDEVLPPRAEGVANYRDSKAGRPLVIRPVFMRGFGATTISRADGQLPLAELTATHDLAGVLVDPENPWCLDGVLALVENLELFVHVEEVVEDIDAALWTAGRLDQRVLDWIASMPSVQVLHVGDYDPVGLDEYMRVRAALPEGRANLFVPADLEERLVKYGKVDLLLRSIAVLERVRRDGPEEVQAVLAIIDKHGKALEQEGLLISSTDQAPGLEATP